jgi:ribokinase
VFGVGVCLGGRAPLRQPAVAVHRVLDTTGAGDCFTAAFAVANVEGRPDPEALRFAGVGAGCGANH